jgi:SAM-dependent methyltransferase
MKSKLRRLASRIAEQSMENVRYLVADARARLASGDSMVPPESLVFVGTGDFEAVGEQFKGHLIELAGLMPDHQVLDVGCGIGRIAIPLTSYLSAKGGYRGIDIVKKGIRWCNSRITRRYRNFRFIHTDIHNRTYNRNGHLKADTFRFPFDDASFDVVLLTSVFTHMLPADVSNYLGEISRVLKPGGRMLATFFLLNKESNALLKAGRAEFGLVRQSGVHAVRHTDRPEDAVGYDEDHVLDELRRVGLDLVQPIHYGSWCGRPNFLSYQDMVIAEKPHA